MIAIKDVIEHLKTMPQDMEVWETWDESGEYWPVTKQQGRIDHVINVRRTGRRRWEKSQNNRGKAVCVLLARLGQKGE